MAAKDAEDEDGDGDNKQVGAVVKVKERRLERRAISVNGRQVTIGKSR